MLFSTVVQITADICIFICLGDNLALTRLLLKVWLVTDKITLVDYLRVLGLYVVIWIVILRNLTFYSNHVLICAREIKSRRGSGGVLFNFILFWLLFVACFVILLLPRLDLLTAASYDLRLLPTVFRSQGSLQWMIPRCLTGKVWYQHLGLLLRWI